MTTSARAERAETSSARRRCGVWDSGYSSCTTAAAPTCCAPSKPTRATAAKPPRWSTTLTSTSRPASDRTFSTSCARCKFCSLLPILAGHESVSPVFFVCGECCRMARDWFGVAVPGVSLRIAWMVIRPKEPYALWILMLLSRSSLSGSVRGRGPKRRPERWRLFHQHKSHGTAEGANRSHHSKGRMGDRQRFHDPRAGRRDHRQQDLYQPVLRFVLSVPRGVVPEVLGASSFPYRPLPPPPPQPPPPISR